MTCTSTFIGAKALRSGKWLIYLADATPWGYVPTCSCWSDIEPTYSVGDVVRVSVDFRYNKTFVRILDEERS